MNRDGMRRVLELCEQALARPAAEREGYLDQACAGDGELRAAVGALLAEQSELGSFLDRRPWAAERAHLAAGSRLGPYEIVAPIGAGGMGEVYEARDTRLGRRVAIKVLPQLLSEDPDRRARFEREAKTIAGLNHPHICTLHDVGEHEGSTFLVMEHIVGETLAARLEKGPLPLEQSLRIATEIAEALSAAHRRGVVHRDLKPANVMLTRAGGVRQGSPQAKLLDFGLAKLTGHGEHPAAAHAAFAMSTPAATLTGQGAIVGTLQYMAPEQLEGKPPDARTDLWALGAILYEMLTGKRAFEGTSAVSLMTAIMEREPPPMRSLQPLTPPALEHLVMRCLSKDPHARWQTATDLGAELRWLATAPGVVSGPPTGRGRVARWTRVVALLCLVGVAAAIAGIVFGLRPWTATARAVRPAHLAVPLSTWNIVLDVGQGSGALALSPDGQTLVFAGHRPGEATLLWKRSLDDPEPVPLKGTERARLPFFSPDGRYVAFQRGFETLLRVSLDRGAPREICEVGPFMGGAWGDDGVIVYANMAPNESGLMSVSAEGGSPVMLVPVPVDGSTARVAFPEWLPEGRGILFTSYGSSGSRVHVWSRGGGLKTLMPGAHARYLSTGHLLYEDGETLRLVAFDLRQLAPSGPSLVVAQQVVTGLARVMWATAGPDTLVYAPSYTELVSLVWRDRDGRRTPLPLNPRRYGIHPALSRVDGRHLAIPVATSSGLRLFAGTTEREPLQPLTPNLGETYFPSFTEDGKWVLFTAADVKGRYNIFRIASDGSGGPERLTEADEWHGAAHSSPDGKSMLVTVTESGGACYICEKRLDPPGPLRPFSRTPGAVFEGFARYSPDGRWVAYMVNITGTNEVWVKDRQPNGQARQLSTDGGWSPVWGRRGDELFYRGKRGMMRVAFAEGRPGAPTQLFPMETPTGNSGMFDLDPNTGRFLTVEADQSAERPSQIYIVQNWFETLKAKAPPAR